MPHSIRPVNKVVWAVDPFEELGPVRKRCISTLRYYAQATGAEIHPIYLLSSADLNLSPEVEPVWVQRYQPAAQKALDEWLKDVDIPGLQPAEVLIQETHSRRGAAERLSHRAKRMGAQMIVVGTHGRKGMSRLLLGSFSESLTLHSSVPVLTVGAHGQIDHAFRSILFPTDLSAASRHLFEDAVALAKRLGAKLTLVHAIPNPVEPIFSSGMFLLGGSWVPIHPYFAKESSERQKKVDAWIHWARRKGVDARALIEDQSGNIAQMILAIAAKEGCDLIMMSAQTGPIASILIGSISRQVVRTSPCPVLILHPRNDVKAARIPRAGSGRGGRAAA